MSYINRLCYFISCLFFIGCNDSFVVFSENLVLNVFDNQQLTLICSGDDVASCTVNELSTGFLSVLAEDDLIPDIMDMPHLIDFIDENGNSDVIGGYLNNGIQARITNSGFSLISQEIKTILNNRLREFPGDTPHICISVNDENCDQSTDGFTDLDNSFLSINVCPAINSDTGTANICNGVPGCRLDIVFENINIEPKNITSGLPGIFEDFNFDELLVNTTVSFGLGVATEEERLCASSLNLEPPIDKNCNSIGCNCANGNIPIEVKDAVDIIGDDRDSCELAIAARDFRLDFDITFFNDVPAVGQDPNLSSRELSFDIQSIGFVDSIEDDSIFDIEIFKLNRNDPSFDKCGRLRFDLNVVDGSEQFEQGLKNAIRTGINNGISNALSPGSECIEEVESASNLPRVRSRILLDDNILTTGEGDSSINLNDLIEAGTKAEPRDFSLLNLSGIFDLIIAAGDYAASEQRLESPSTNLSQNGLSFGIKLGINGDADRISFIQDDRGGEDGHPFTTNDCVPLRTPPRPGRAILPGEFVFLNPLERILDRAEEFSSNELPGPNTPYHVGLGLSEGVLDIVGYQLYNSGFLCLKELGLEKNEVLSSQDILSTDLIDDLLPSIIPQLPRISIPGSGQSPPLAVPLFLTLKPQNPPDFSIGDGTAGSPLLILGLQDLEFEVFVLIDSAKTLLFRTRVSGSVGFNIEIEPPTGGNNGTFVLTFDTQQLENLSVSLLPIQDEFNGVPCLETSPTTECFVDLLGESKDQVQNAVLPVVQKIFEEFNTKFLGTINAPNLLGFSFDLDNTVIQKVSKTSSPSSDNFIGFFATLSPPASVIALSLSPVNTQAHVVDTISFDTTLQGYESWPGATLSLGGDSAVPGSLEWQTRVDGGMWSSFTQHQNLLLRDPKFFNKSEHRVEVRARLVGKPKSLDPTPVSLKVVIGREESADTSETISEEAGCSIEPGRSSFGALVFSFLLFFGVFMGRKRTTPSGVSLLVLVLLFVGCSEQTSSLPELSLRSNQGNHGNQGTHLSCQVDAECASVSCSPPKAPICRRNGSQSSGTCRCERVNLTLGEVGRFLDMAVFEGRAYLVAYNQTYGDLMFAKVKPKQGCDDEDNDEDHQGQGNGHDSHGNGNGNGHNHHDDDNDGHCDEEDECSGITATSVEEWKFLDGVPDGPVVGSSGDLRRGILAPGPDVGQYASLAVDSEGRAHIAYFDVSQGNLKYARVAPNGRLQVKMTIDADPGVVGRFTDIIIGADGTPQISYLATQVVDTAGGPPNDSQLRFIKANLALPLDASHWAQPVIVDSVVVQFSLPSGIETPPVGVGLFTSMALSDGNKTFIAYSDSFRSDSRIAYSASATSFLFTTQKLDLGSSNNDLGNAGSHSFLLADSTARHYAMKSNAKLIYFQNEQFPGETIDDGKRTDLNNQPREHYVGSYVELLTTTILGADEVFAFYQDGTDNQVILAKRTPAAWLRTSLTAQASVGASGFFIAARINDTNPKLGIIAHYLRTPGATNNRVELLTVDLSVLDF